MGGQDETLTPQEAAAFDPTIIEGEATLGLSHMEQDLINEALSAGLITQVQADLVLESLQASQEVSGPTATVQLLVTRGLISESAADKLRSKVTADFIPGYELLGELGRGAMGVVYKARQRKLDRQVALKVVNPQIGSDPSYVKRFKQEALALAKLNHPNIVQVYDYGEANDKIFLALEFVEGQDVAAYMRERKSLSPETVIKIVRDAALGLSHAQKAGIIHRDIKPANLLLLSESQDARAQDFTVKVTDLGLARNAEPQEGAAELTKAGTILGTPAYMAPEQTTGKGVDYRSDIYALGATFYHLATGDIPYSSTSVVNILVKKRTEKLEDPRRVVPDMDPGIVRVMDRMLARAPEDRYQTYEALISDLDALLAGKPPSTPKVPLEHSSLRLSGSTSSRLSVAKGFSDLETQEMHAPPTPSSGGGLGVGLAVGLVLLVLAGGGVFASRFFAQSSVPTPPPTPTPRATPTPAATPEPTPTPAPVASATPSAASAAEQTLATLDSLPPEERLAELEVVTQLQESIAALPAAERTSLELRLRALVSGALRATLEATLTKLGELHAARRYAELGEAATQALVPYERFGREVPTALGDLARIAEQANAAGAGRAETEAWGAIEGAEGPLALLAASEGFAERFPFSPGLEELARRRAEAEGQAPQVVLAPEPAEAELQVDGEAVGSGTWEGRLLPGEHRVQASAAGYFPLDARFTVPSDEPIRLRLGPAPAMELGQDPTHQAQVWRPSPRAFERIWTRIGAWKPILAEAGMIGEAPDGGGFSTARRELAKAVAKFQGEPGWSLSLQVLVRDAEGEATPTPADVQAAVAEVRLALEGQSFVAGIRAGGAYLGVRTPAALDVHREQPRGDTARTSLRLDWDGTVLLLYLNGEVFHSLRPGVPLNDLSLEFAISRGKVVFRNIEMFALRVP